MYKVPVSELKEYIENEYRKLNIWKRALHWIKDIMKMKE